MKRVRVVDQDEEDVVQAEEIAMDEGILDMAEEKLVFSPNSLFFLYKPYPTVTNFLQSKGKEYLVDETKMDSADYIVISQDDFLQALRCRNKYVYYAICINIPFLQPETFEQAVRQLEFYPLKANFPEIDHSQYLLRDIWVRYGIVVRVPLSLHCELLDNSVINEVEKSICRHMQLYGLAEGKSNNSVVFVLEVLAPIVQYLGGMLIDLGKISERKILIHIGSLVVTVVVTTTRGNLTSKDRALAFVELLGQDNKNVTTVILTNGSYWELYQCWPENRGTNKVKVSACPPDETQAMYIGEPFFGNDSNHDGEQDDYLRVMWGFTATQATRKLLNAILELFVRVKYHHIVEYEYDVPRSDACQKMIENLVTVRRNRAFSLRNFLLLLECDDGFKNMWLQAVQTKNTTGFVNKEFPGGDHEFVLKVIELLSQL